MIIALDIIIIMRSSINCSAVICSSTVLFAIFREASSETYGHQVYFPSCKFPIYYFVIFYFLIYKPKTQKYLLYLLFSFIYLYQISLLQVAVKGLTTPLSRWVQVFDCLCMYWGFVRCLLRDWYLGSLIEGNTYLYFAASPFPLQGKNQRKLKK